MSDDHRHDDLHDRLEHLEARMQALEAELAGRQQGGGGQKYYASGSVHPELDDQAIAP